MTRSRLPLPLLHDLRTRPIELVGRDLIAGLSSAVVLVPQSIAYATLAGLPPVAGLYAALVPPIGYALLGSSRELSVGPVAMDSLLVLSTLNALSLVTADNYIVAAALLALTVGLLQISMGLLKLGYIVNFLSQPVLSGFTSGTAVLIALSQLHHLLGIPGGKGSTSWEILANLGTGFGQVGWRTVGVSALSMGVLLGLKKTQPKLPGPFVVLTIMTLGSWLFHLEGVRTVGPVPNGLPRLSVPTASPALFLELLPGAATLALVGFMESIAAGRRYSQINRYAIYPDRELVALGTANVLGGFFQCYPVAGGLTRTAVNADAGARSSLSILVSSLLVGLTLLFFTPLFSPIPQAALSTIVILAVIGLVDLKDARERYVVKKADGALLVLTFSATLGLGVIFGLVLGITSSVLWFVFHTTRPHVAVLGRVPGTTLFRNVTRYRGLTTYEGVLIVRVDAQLYFANTAFVRDRLEFLEETMSPPLTALILDAAPLNDLDSSAVELLEDLFEKYSARGIGFYLAGIKGPVRDILERAGLWQRISKNASCLSVHEALEVHQSRSLSLPSPHLHPTPAPTL